MGLPRGLSVKVVILVVAFRLTNSLLCRTFFQPDEYYQSIEIAHRLVFGYGYETWEWRSRKGQGGIRSPLVPFLYVPAYQLLKTLGIDRLPLMIVAPKVTSALVMSLGDLSTYAAAENLLGAGFGNAALLCSLTNFFNAYAGVRSFSNSVETALTATALACWPWDARALDASWTRFAISLCFAALAVIIRPASILQWAPLGLSLFSTACGEAKVDILAWTSVIGVAASSLCGFVDSAFYKTSAFTPLAFFRQNVLNNVSVFYGASPWHFYLTQGFTLVNWSLFPTVLLGMFGAASPHETASTLVRLRGARTACLVSIFGLSLLSHKELRFLQSLLPLFNCFAARALVNAWMRLASPAESRSWLADAKVRPVGFVFRTMCAIFPAVYLMRYQHQAQVGVMPYLSSLEDVKSIGMLMPCHSTPWQSHLHRTDLASTREGHRLWMLTCEPPLDGQDHASYQDEADRFYADPVTYLALRFPPTVDPSFPPQIRNETAPSIEPTQHAWPSHIVAFEALLADEATGAESPVAAVLKERGYIVSRRLWNSRWHEDPRRKGDVVVFAWSP